MTILPVCNQKKNQMCLCPLKTHQNVKPSHIQEISPIAFPKDGKVKTLSVFISRTLSSSRLKSRDSPRLRTKAILILKCFSIILNMLYTNKPSL
jgi:hypothetical protein